MLELKSEFLCELIADLAEPQSVGAGPRGIRMIYPVKGGTIEGPDVKGEILPGGADWFLIRSDGAAELDVRATSRMEDGSLIYAYYRGIIKAPPAVMERIQKGEDVDPSEYYFRTTPVFETGSEKYSWLNQIISVGVGTLRLDQVRYKVYRIL